MKPKGKNALVNLKNIAVETTQIIALLEKARNRISDVIVRRSSKDNSTFLHNNKRKKRSMIYEIPDRLEFSSCHLRFYILH